jgi:hypothetical protein
MTNAAALSTPSQVRARTAAEHRRELARAIQRCFFCSKPVRVKDGWVAFYSDWGAGKLGYPCTDAGATPVAHFEHTRCGPDDGYALELKQCVEVGRHWGLISHIREKVWCSHVYLHALVLAEGHVLAEVEIAREKRRLAARRPAAR